MTENTEEKQKEHLFKKGESGNPKGRPRGARNKATVAAYELLKGETEAITRKAIEAAKDGDMVAIRLCLDRILPAMKNAPMPSIQMPELKTASDIPIYFEAINGLLANGEVSESELSVLLNLVDKFGRSVDVAQLEQRIEALECKK